MQHVDLSRDLQEDPESAPAAAGALSGSSCRSRERSTCCTGLPCGCRVGIAVASYEGAGAACKAVVPKFLNRILGLAYLRRGVLERRPNACISLRGGKDSGSQWAEES